MHIDLTGKTAVVTGGNSGIGRAFSMALARSGASVVATYFTGDFEPFAEDGQTIFGVALDATDSEQVDAVMAEAAKKLGGKVDILINNAGGLMGRVLASDMSDEHFHNVMDTNFSSAFYCTRAVLPYMPDGGRIVNLSSLAAHDGGGNGSVIYAASKAAVIGFTRGMAKELGPRNITVNALAPGFIANTAFHNTFTPEAVQEANVSKTPLHRAGTPDDVACAALYLISDMSSFITGEVMEINGGLYFV
ncbi:MAG: SDR family oxidoreductase [Chloroflexi bacterium]|jgi:3-oxoacyl-[acyl-carrier protein] reductase|nr:SDR family oxidoreductase [Chloroflexota bacterium]